MPDDSPLGGEVESPFPFALTPQRLAGLGQALLRMLLAKPDELRELQVERARLELAELLGKGELPYERVPFGDLAVAPAVTFLGPTGSGKTAAALALARVGVETHKKALRTNIEAPGLRGSSFADAVDCVYLWDDPAKPERGRDAALGAALQRRRHRNVHWIVTAPLPSSHQLDVLRYSDIVVATGYNRAQWSLHDLPEPWPEQLDRLGRLSKVVAEKGLLAAWVTATDDLLAVPRPELPKDWSDRLSRWCR